MGSASYPVADTSVNAGYDQMTAAPEQKREVAARAMRVRFSSVVRMASHLRSLALAALGASSAKAALMEHMNGSQVELTLPRLSTEARPVGARRSCIPALPRARSEVRAS